VVIPDGVLGRIETADDRGTAREEGIRIAQELVLALRDRIQGIYIMPPFRRYDVAAEVLSVLR
jgi:homocysteine S-methyltransferase